LQIAAALWHYIEDLDRWRLIIGNPANMPYMVSKEAFR
jgi:hypothetical protein